MSDDPNFDRSPDRDADPPWDAWREWRLDDARHPDRGSDAPAGGRGLSDDVRRLSRREERDLHFNGHPRYNMRPLHDLCSPGGCRYLTEAENCADLEAWYGLQNAEADRDDPEADLRDRYDRDVDWYDPETGLDDPEAEL
jgi:hypothetical protein